MEQPRYLEAFTENNSPRYDWGPKKRINHYGLYAHLNTSQSNEQISVKPGTNTFINQTFQGDNISNKSITNGLQQRI